MHKWNVLEIYNQSNNLMRHVHEKKIMKCMSYNQPFGEKHRIMYVFSGISAVILLLSDKHEGFVFITQLRRSTMSRLV